MSRKTWIVVRREFVSTVCRKGWLIGTFAMPLILIVYGGLVALPIHVMVKKQGRVTQVGLVDETGLVRLPEGGAVEARLPAQAEAALESTLGHSQGIQAVSAMLGKTQFILFPDETSGKMALEAKKIATLFVVPRDYLESGKVIGFRLSGGGMFMDLDVKGQDAMKRLMVHSLLEGKVDSKIQERVLSPARGETFVRERDGSYQKAGILTIVRSFGIPLGFSLLLMFALLGSAGLLLQGVSEEKENRVIEVILSSVDARSLLFGKLLGLGAAGLLQLLVWLVMAVVPVLLFVAGLTVQTSLVCLSLVYFVLGFLLFGTLMTGTGVLGATFRESQQLGMFWAIGSAIPMMLVWLILDEPNGAPARILTYIPLTAPVTMILRLGSGEVPWWEIVLSIVLLACSIWLALRLVSRIFRTALLMYGKRPTLPEVFRWLRRA